MYVLRDYFLFFINTYIFLIMSVNLVKICYIYQVIGDKCKL